MKSSYTRRYRRHSKPAKTDQSFFKKESQETFFGTASTDVFFQPAVASSSMQSVHRKCEDCEKEEKKVHRREDKKEEEKVMKLEDKKDEEKVQRQSEKEEENVQRVEDKKEDEEEKVQKKESGATPAVGKSVGTYINSLNGKGKPLPAQANHFFSSRMGYDFSDVKVHNDKEAAESAKAINAKAYTVGNNVVFNEGQYSIESGEGKRLMAHELAHVMQNDHSLIMTDKLDPAHVSAWQATTRKAFDKKSAGDVIEAEKYFIDALGLLGEHSVNNARDGFTVNKNLKPGINFDIADTSAKGHTGYLTSKGFIGRLPFDEPFPESATIITTLAFNSQSPVLTMMVLAHEKQHFEHDRAAVKLLAEWKKKEDMKKFDKQFDKQKTAFLKEAARLRLDQDTIDRGITELKATLIYVWAQKHKGKDNLDTKLLYEFTGPLQADMPYTEVLSALSGFIAGFHFIDIVGGKSGQDLFDELIAYPVEKELWSKIAPAIKDQYKVRIQDYYCKKLDKDHQVAFQQHVTDYSAKTWKGDPKPYFSMLANLKCK
jgi:hypothetical protein